MDTKQNAEEILRDFAKPKGAYGSAISTVALRAGFHSSYNFGLSNFEDKKKLFYKGIVAGFFNGNVTITEGISLGNNQKIEIVVGKNETQNCSYFRKTPEITFNNAKIGGYRDFVRDLTQKNRGACIFGVLKDLPYKPIDGELLFGSYDNENARDLISIKQSNGFKNSFYGNICDTHVTYDNNVTSFFPSLDIVDGDYHYMVINFLTENKAVRPYEIMSVDGDLLIIRRKKSEVTKKEEADKNAKVSDNQATIIPSTTKPVSSHNGYVTGMYSTSTGWKEAQAEVKNLYAASEEVKNLFAASNSSKNTNKKEGKDMFKDRFNSLMPEKVQKGVAFSINGKVAVKARNGNYVSFNKDTGQIEDYMDFVFGEDKVAEFCFLMPVDRNLVKVGDVVVTNGGYGFVTDIGKDGEIVCVDASDATKAEVVPVKNILTNTTMVKKLITMFDNVGQANGINPAMFLLMDKNTDGKDNKDLFKYMMMFQMMSGQQNPEGGFGGINPMMFMLM